jgi:hypothetical protein
MQNFKAAAMGVVAAIDFFRSNVANPAMGKKAGESGA